MKPSELERLPLRIEQLYREIGELMMEDVVRRIRKTGKITSTADYQIQRLTMLGATSEEIEREIQKRLKLSNSELWRLYEEVIDWEYVRSKDVYEQINSNFIPWEDNYQLQHVTHAIMENALDDLKNITRSMGFAINQGGKTVFVPMVDYYQKYLDQTLLGIVTGAFDYNSALRKCVTQMTNSGIRTVDYASGHSNRIDVAARRAVMTGLSQVTGRITDYHANRLGIDTFEVAWHAGARNTGVGFYNHQSWQGKVYTRQQLIDICGLGQGGGLCGWNCYHEYYMFFPGLSKRNWSDDWLEGMNQAENIPREYNGKWYDMYAATQKQRQMETAMRAQREKVRLLQAGGADKDDILNQQIRYNGQLYEYVKFSNKMNLKQQKERIYLDMRGKVGLNFSTQIRVNSDKKAFTNEVKNDKIKLTREERRAINQYISFESYVINDKLRKGIKLTDEEEKMKKNLDSALKKMPNYDGNLSRSLYFGDEQAAKDFAENFIIGKKVNFKEYISTTSGSELYNPDGEVQIFIHDAKAGRDLSAFNAGEREVLYERESKFKVDNVVEKNGVIYILLKEM